MTMQKKYIKDKDGNKVLPITHQSAVKNNEGTPLDTVIEDINEHLSDNDSRLDDLEAMEQIVIDGGEAQIAQGSDFDNPDATKRAKVPTVGAVLDGISEGVFDLTAKTGDSYASLQDALTAANTAIPANKKRGGMQLSFVLSVDNTYVQFRLMLSTFTAAQFANPAYWQNETNVLNADIYKKSFYSNGNTINQSNLPFEAKGIEYISGQGISIVERPTNDTMLAFFSKDNITKLDITLAEGYKIFYLENVDVITALNIGDNNISKNQILGQYTYSNWLDIRSASVFVKAGTNTIIIGIKKTAGNITTEDLASAFSITTQSAYNIYRKAFEYSGGSHSSASDYVVTDIKQGEEVLVAIKGLTTQQKKVIYISSANNMSDAVSVGSATTLDIIRFTAPRDIKSLGLSINLILSSTVTIDYIVMHGDMVKAIKSFNSDLIQRYAIASERLLFYTDYSRPLKFEKSGSSLLICPNQWFVRGYVNLDFVNNTAFATELNTTVVTSPSGVANCIELPNEKSIIYRIDDNKFYIVNTTSIVLGDIEIITCRSGNLIYLYPTLEVNYFNPQIKKNSDDIATINNKLYTVVPPEKSDEFSSLIVDATGKVESFVYFSDPHWYQNHSEFGLASGKEAYIHQMKRYFDTTPLDFVLCGGDILQDHVKSVAVEDLAQYDGVMNKLFLEKYYMMFGNHDDNNQGEGDIEGESGRLSTTNCINLNYRKYGRLYYSFKGNNTKFYILNSGQDWDNNMSQYRWDQIEWLAQELLAGNDEHIIIGLHIVATNKNDFDGSVMQFADLVTKLCKAFNERTSVTLSSDNIQYSNTFDFTGVSVGTIHCAMCGHTHADYMTVVNDIPVYVITTAYNGDFDLILVDYGANKLKSIRVGTGNDREMNLANSIQLL